MVVIPILARRLYQMPYSDMETKTIILTEIKRKA
jgi:hypothetical protein